METLEIAINIPRYLQIFPLKGFNRQQLCDSNRATVLIWGGVGNALRRPKSIWNNKWRIEKLR
ncbi:MAG: hypothetical protein U5K75_10300 [Ahrensia sp.]|nr:hypothetical protein [Ahrensia sp.]